MLYAINHDLRSNLWCGPAAISTLTGQPTSAIHAVIKAERNNPNALIKGMYNGEMFRVLRRFGKGCKPLDTVASRFVVTDEGRFKAVKAPTLGSCVRDLQRQADGRPILVNVTGHYLVVEKGWTIDNQRSAAAVKLKDSRHLRKRVKAAWVIFEMPGGAQPIPVLPAKPKVVDTFAKYRKTAKEVALKHSIEIEKTSYGDFNVWPPQWLEDRGIDDPYEGDHNASDWKDVHAMVIRYAGLST